MNWRGRPLTSHEVIVQTIAATTTRTGLTVEAKLDTGAYPTGITVTDAAVAALPMSRHDFHGDWNYTLHSEDQQVPGPTAPDGRELAPTEPVSTNALAHSALTGMSRDELDTMTAQLASAQAAQRERQRRARRGAERRRAPGAGARPKLTGAERILATVLYLRKLCSQAVLGELFAVDRKTITTAVQENRPLLEELGYVIAPSTARFPTPADLIAFLARTPETPTEIKSAC